ncbi:hypothetical protein ACLB2K_048528 [Fragaria x ananassa]
MELEFHIIKHLPVFRGLRDEDPILQYLKQVEFVCARLVPPNVDIVFMKLKVFPYSLMDQAKKWFLSISINITSWGYLMELFLSKYSFQARRTLQRMKIGSLRQQVYELYLDYYKRFQDMIYLNCDHEMDDASLLSCFYQGLLDWEKQILDTSAGGSFLELKLMERRMLIRTRAMIVQPSLSN